MFLPVTSASFQADASKWATRLTRLTRLIWLMRLTKTMKTNENTVHNVARNDPSIVLFVTVPISGGLQSAKPV
jgi:hypothetical protein